MSKKAERLISNFDNKLEPGCIYTVTRGQYKGRTGMACLPWWSCGVIVCMDFPDAYDYKMGLNHTNTRPATVREERDYWRSVASGD
jgi:hypothetical protein